MRVAILNPAPLHRQAVGGVTRVYGLARFLAGRGHDVHVFAQASGDSHADAAAIEELRELNITQRVFPVHRPTPIQKLLWFVAPLPYFVYARRSREIQAALKGQDLQTPFDIVHAEMAYLAPWFEGVRPAAARILAEQECMSLQIMRLRHVPFAQRSRYERVIVHRLEAVKRFEARALQCFDKVFAITPVEQDYMRAFVPSVAVLPHVVSVDDFEPVASEPEDGPALFVGNFQHSPNLHAARWFVDHVWPNIMRARPGARLQIVGPGLDRLAASAFAVPGVEMVGPVTDLAARYRTAAVFVNPIVSGGGMRGKVLEAFSCARPVVSTPLGMEGIAGISGTHYLEAEHPERFAAAVLTYFDDRALRQKHGAAARRLAAEHYDRRVVFAELESCYEAAVRDKRSPRMHTIRPRLSVQIVTWNSVSKIGGCLESLAGQSDRRFEVIVVDNASADDTVQVVKSWLEKGLPGTVVVEPVNRGFCGGHNRALLRASGDLILVLNPDARLPADFVARAIATADRLPPDVGTIAPQLVRPDGTLDSAGLFCDRFRRAYDRGQGESPARYSMEEDVLACTGAAALHRRTMLEDVAHDGKPFDEGLFAYYDDLEICWRAQLRGWRCRYVPTLTAEHERAGRNAFRRRSKGNSRSRDQILMVRNRLLMMARCERPVDLLISMPWLLPFELAQMVYLAARRPWVLRGYVEAIRDMPQALRDRSQIHSRKGAPGRSPRSLVPFQR